MKKNKRKWKLWSKREEEIIKENIGYKTAKEIGKMVKRSGTQVNMKIDYMRKTGEDIASVEDVAEIKEAMRRGDINFIKSNLGMSTQDIADELNKSKVYIYNLIIELENDPDSNYLVERTAMLQKNRQERLDKLRRARIERVINKGKLTKEEQKKEEERQERIKAQLEKERIKTQKIYDNAIKRKITIGVYKKDLKVKLGQPYEIERVVKSTKDWNKFAGKCMHETKDHITIKNKIRAETFLKVDFLINEYKIKEIA